MARRYSLPIVVYWVAFMWAIFLLDAFLSLQLIRFGIVPRETSGLIGILCSPFLHNGSLHIISNSVPLLVMGILVQSYGRAIYLRASFIIILCSGTGVWLFSQPAVVVGASGLVFGFWSFLLAAVLFRRSFSSLLIATLTMLLYGGLLWSVFEVRERISWSGHFWGAVGGVVAAYFCLGKKRRA